MPTKTELPPRHIQDRLTPLYTRDAGQGQGVVLLHAFPLNSRMWEPQLEGLCHRARLVAPDLPGFGLSPAPTTIPSLDDYASQILATLDALGVDQVVLVGLSLGGYVAFRLVGHLGARLQGLFLADTKATPDTEEAMLRRRELTTEIEQNGVDVIADAIGPQILGGTTQQLQPGLLDTVRVLIRENTPVGLASALRAMAARPDSTPLLSRLRCPVVCVVGAEDSLIPLEAARTMTTQIPGARLQTIPEAGHLSNLEAPEAFNEALEILLAECSPARA